MSSPSAAELAGWKQVIPFNVARLAINTYWWHENVEVPTYNNEHFQNVIAGIIQLNKQNGIYTMLDMGTQFAEPPCGGSSGNFCTSQNQAGVDFDAHCQSYIKNKDPQNCLPWAEYLNSYVPPNGSPSMAELALTDLIKLYGNDPAVIYDLYNEPHTHDLLNTSEYDFFQQMHARIKVVHNLAPQALVFVYTTYYPDIRSGHYTYPSGNVVLDFHIYDSNFDGTTFTQDNLNYNQSNGWGTIVNEYGGSGGGPNSPPAANELSSLYNVVKAGGNGMLVWDPKSNLLTNNSPPYILNDAGRMVCATYSTLFGMSPTSCGSIPPGFPQQ